jgi:hypothetical protein
MGKKDWENTCWLNISRRHILANLARRLWLFLIVISTTNVVIIDSDINHLFKE